MIVQDEMILARDATGHTRINWNEWHGDKVIYRRVTPSRINWRLLPEIVVLLEPTIGERIFYNPLASPNTIRTETEARDRLGRIWQELYGRQPQFVGPTLPLSQVLDRFSAVLTERRPH